MAALAPNCNNPSKNVWQDEGWTELLRKIVQGELCAQLRRSGVALFIVDSLIDPFLPLITATGVPTVRCNTMLDSPNRSTPPLGNHFLPTPSFLGIGLSKLLWAREWRRKVGQQWLSRSFFGLPALPTPLKEYGECQRLLRRLRKSQGLTHELRWGGYRLKPIPEFVLSPKTLEFPFANWPQCFHAGAGVDVERKEFDFPFDKLPKTHPLVYVSLGSHTARYPDAIQFFPMLVESARALPQFFFVVSVGRGGSEGLLKNLPTNLMVVRFAPQIGLLQRAVAMVTNGGLGTVKECIWYEVPMVILPCKNDQPGNAARVAYHNIGRRGQIRKLSPKKLALMIEDCVNNPHLRRNLKRMSSQMRREEDPAALAKWLESKVKPNTHEDVSCFSS